jgi:ABC-2 type transport system ATP-binding protein
MRKDAMNDFAIEARSLQKTFTTKQGFWQRKTKTTVAVEDVSFNVERGELFGLLGPNGSGKTTTVKMLSTLLLPTAGTALVLGLDVTRETHKVRQRIGFTFGGARGLYSRLTANDNLRYFSELYGLEPSVSRARIPELLELVGLTGRGDDRVETYSSGMQQRLHLARALLHDPELIFLDEPTVGIDPVGARELRSMVKRLVAMGKTILLTTHYMAEAEELCDRIAIIKQGRIVALDTPAALKQRISGDSVIDVQIKNENALLVLGCLQALNGHATIQVTETPPFQCISIRTPAPGVVMEKLAPFLNPQVIQGLEVRNQTLEDVYVAIIQGDKA